MIQILLGLVSCLLTLLGSDAHRLCIGTCVIQIVPPSLLFDACYFDLVRSIYHERGTSSLSFFFLWFLWAVHLLAFLFCLPCDGSSHIDLLLVFFFVVISIYITLPFWQLALLNREGKRHNRVCAWFNNETCPNFRTLL